MCGKRLKSWKTMPAWRRRLRSSSLCFRLRACSGSASTSMSPMRMVPTVGSSRKLRQRSMVVLPLPERPMSMTVSCWRTTRSTPRST